jgi:ABC-type nitrate/sulfonate/bicarbonate transport system substrate-binding protein
MKHIFLIFPIILIVAACGATEPAASGEPEVREISMRLQWFPQYQFAGYIVAKTQGYYEDAGLDVTLNPGGPDMVPLPLVAGGSDQFGSTGADTVLIARERDIEVLALATWFQASPVGFMVHADSGISGPEDFAGRTVGMFYGDNVETEYRALLAAAGVDRDAINEVPGDFNLRPFLTRQVDVWPVYVTDQPNQARRQGAEVELIVARDYDVQLMGDVLFTTAAFARENPNTVQAFVEATLRGWEYALANPSETVAIIAEYNPELNLEQLQFEAEATIPLIQYGAGERCPGWNEMAAWQGQRALLRDLGLLESEVDLDAAIENRYVEQYYDARGIECGGG